MVSIRIENIAQALLAVAVMGLGYSAGTSADDTEIYQSSYSTQVTGRPKVLIIFDNSGSMRTDVTQQPLPYDPNASYVSAHNNSRIYWSTNGQPPPSNTSQYFTASKNRCAESYIPLQTVGFFQGKARRWEKSDSRVYTSPQRIYNAGWETLSTSDTDPLHVDCEADVVNGNDGNGSVAAGYPFLPPILFNGNGVSYRAIDLEYSAATAAASNVSWGSQGYTFYTAHYMDYFRDPSTLTTRSRMAIARDVVEDLIQGNPGIDFGLAVFNYNSTSSNSGGRIVKRINDSNDPLVRQAYQNSLVTMVQGFYPDTWTPLCETTYEAYRYLAGQSVYYGDDWNGTPSRDLAAEDGSLNYKSPATDCAYTYVILMTDGEPTYDTHANSRIETLTGKTCSNYADGNGGTSKNCLPELAEYMANTDLDNNTTNGDQFAITYTIGFTTNQVLLSDTALKGKGQYYTANSASALTAAFQGAILNILATDATFTSPSVAVDSFTRTQSRNDVFFSMFLPSDTTDWRGNIKKLKVSINNGSATLVDKNNAPAIDSSTGNILSTASTYWSSGDGGAVEKGGMGQLLANRGPTLRTIKTNSGTGGALEDFSAVNLDAVAYGYDLTNPGNPTGALFTYFGVSSQTELDALIDWGRGYQVDSNGTRLGNRPWILADMLHSKPLVVNYGALPSFSVANPDLRVVVGTNAGFLHMFGNDDGYEDWAFFPKELAPILKPRARNAVSSSRVYGIDSSPVLYTKDIGLDGTIDASAGDKAYVYFGLRRGGSMYYALDISNPDSPSFMWKIDPATPGFSELGQSWSIPIVTRIPGYYDLVSGRRVYKPVLIFGAGYDTNKDASGVATTDSMGRGIFIVDATTGALVWSVTPAATTVTNLQEAGLAHSVAGTVSVLDSNADEVTDRIYFGDTGGNIWRVDLPGNELPTSSVQPWRIVKLANMNAGTVATDRRFFNAPDIVRTSYGGTVFDAILIGSGDRTNPKATDVGNQFYMIRDERVAPYFTDRPLATDPECTATPVEDFRCKLPLLPGDLFDVTNNYIQTGSAAQQTAAQAALIAANGWRLDLQASGEKSLSRSLTIDGKVYFGTFAPDIALTNICVPSPGTGRLYVVDLLTAGQVIDFNGDGNKERSWIVGSLIPDTPSPHFGSDGEIRLLLPPGSGGGGAMSNPFLTGSSVPPPYGEYWYREEYQ
jgi:type IV pilus assembly protein PilY1